MALYAYSRRLGGQQQAFFVDVTGTETLEELFDKFPANFSKKVIVSTFRKGAAKYNNKLKRNLPGNLTPLKKLVKNKASKGKIIGLTAGPFANYGTYTNAAGKEFDPFFLLYWSNYGTLDNRDSGHAFDRDRRNKSAHWSGGIKPLGFAERSWEESSEQVKNTVNKEMYNVAIKALKKYRVV